MRRAVFDRAPVSTPISSCQARREQFSEYLDGTLGERDHEGLAAHLTGCSACRAFAGTLEATIRAVRELPREHLLAAARAHLRRRVLAPDMSQRERAEVGQLRPRGLKR